jgi:thiol-disulfide isomerase/thioredoxin
MTKATFSATLFSLLTCSIAFAQGIRFDSTDWKSIVSRAKTEKKMIFVDFYTTWCGPCKRLEKEVFTLPEVGSKFNSSFINARIDAEKGEGIELAARFGVNAYPTSLFIKADDESLVYKTVGFLPANKYLAETDAALDALVKDPLAEMEFEYQKGNRTIDFLNKMIGEKMRFNRPIDRELEAFFITHWVDSFFVKTNERLFRDIKMDINGRAFELLMQRIAQVNQSSFYTLQPSIKQIVDKNLLAAVKNARKTKDEATLERVVNYAASLWTYKNVKNSEIPKYQMLFYQHGSDPDKLVKATTEYMTIGHLMTSTTTARMASYDEMAKKSREKMAGNVSERMTMDSAQIEKAKQNILASSQAGMNLY